MPTPTFLCIGVMKCGTSTLLHYLDQHPAVFIPTKEVHWFDHRHLTADEYAALFSADCAVCGELSPTYIYHIDDIAKYNLKTKLILTIRDPITQFISAMRHWRRDHPTERFDITGMLTSHEKGWEEWHVVLYQPLIEKIVAYGFPFLLINFDDLVHDQQRVFDRLADFLEIPRLVTDYIHANSSEGREMVDLTPDQLTRLRRIHAPSLDFLRQRYGIEFIEKYEITER